MLLFSRGGETIAKPFLLPPLIKEGIKMMRSSLPSCITINTKIGEVLPAIMMDPVQLQQILMNLFINARDSIDGHGEILIELSWAKDILAECSSCHKHIYGNWVSLAVTDNGHGMASENIEKIFAPFYSTKEAGKGTGMGLAVVHGILHKHNAHVVVRSAQGSGTSFKILFPPIKSELDVSEQTNKEFNSVKPPSLGNILLIDDEVSVAGFMQEVLTNEGFNVQTFNSPRKALERFNQSPLDFDLLITDQTMPEMTGVELIKHCKEKNQLLPVIMSTGYSDQIDEQKASSFGIDHFFYKPVDINKLLKVVDELISNNKSINRKL